MSRFCSNCGAELNERDNFCPRCGKEIFTTNTSSTSLPPTTSLWKRIFTTKGRLNRLPYFTYSIVLAIFAFSLIIGGISLMARPNSTLGTGFGIFLGFIFIVALVAQIMLAVRRLHDLNFNGW